MFAVEKGREQRSFVPKLIRLLRLRGEFFSGYAAFKEIAVLKKVNAGALLA
jgi:hypothetical protein